MKETAAIAAVSVSSPWTKLADYLELTKPRIAMLVLFTVLSGGVIAAGTSVDLWLMLHAVAGTALVASGATILNQVIERSTDARMNRTADRPLPTGRVGMAEATALGYGAAALGGIYLGVVVSPLAASIALLSFALYVFAYTPLKRVTSLNTVVGAVPGALPPLVGYAAAHGSLDAPSLWLFLLLFVWQFPHFFAIAWLYRDDYKRAGLHMLPTTRLGRRVTALQIVAFCLLLFPVTLVPVAMGYAGSLTLVGGILLGSQFLGFGIAFLLRQNRQRARRVLWSSLIYLPVMLVLWMMDAAQFGG